MGAANEASKQKKEEKHHEKQEKLHDALEELIPGQRSPGDDATNAQIRRAERQEEHREDEALRQPPTLA